MNKIDCYVINLENKKEEYNKFKLIWEKYFNIIRFNAIEPNNNNLTNKECCKLSHLNLMRDLVKNGNNKFYIIMEDDVYPTELFNEYFNLIIDFATNEKSKYDFIHLDIFLNLDNKINNCVKKYNDIFYEYYKGRNMGFMIYNSSFLNSFVNSPEFEKEFKNSNCPLDVIITHSHKFLKLTPKRIIVRQFTNKKSSIPENKRYTINYDNWYDISDKYLIEQEKSTT